MSAIFHGFLLLSSAILIPSLLNYIPLAALACILLMVGYKLSKAGLFIGMYRLGWEQFLPFVVTVTAILFTDLLRGIGIGMVVAIYFILMRNYRHSYHGHVETGANGEETIVLALSEEVTFLNKGSIQLTLDHLPDNSTVFIDGSKCMNIDFDVLEAIQNFREHTAPPRGIKVMAKGLSTIQPVGGH
jgi:MFS superfamily sulfate permease-like transporter